MALAKYLLPAAVMLLMIATGMSLDWRQCVAIWRRLTLGRWLRLLLVTFVIPPDLALLLGATLPIGLGAMGGLYLIAVVPGAPLMTRNAAKRGFDLELSAFYQLWGALLAPVMLPLLVAIAAWLYGRDISISPLEILRVVAIKQFAPLMVGMALMHFAPGFSKKLRRPFNLIGNGVLTVAIIGLLIKLGPTLRHVSLVVVFAAVVLAVGCLVAGLLLFPTARTLAVSNVNRHVGLALLLSTEHLQSAQQAIPAIACYAIAAPIVMWAAGRLLRRSEKTAEIL